MARILHPYDERRHGKLALQTGADADCVEVYYIPPSEQLEQSSIEPAKRTGTIRQKLLKLDKRDGRLTIFPINTMGKRSDFLGPKYDKVQMITLADAKPVMDISHGDEDSLVYRQSITFGPTKPLENIIEDDDISDDPMSTEDIMQILESLPPAFTKDYDYGLGFAQPYRFIVEAIEKLSDCTEVIISHDCRTGIDKTQRAFCISAEDFEAVRKLLNRTTVISQSASRSVNSPWKKSIR